MRNTVLFLIVCIGFVAPAKAEIIPMPPELQAYLMRPEQQKAVVGMMSQQWKMLMNNCPNPRLENTNVLISTLPKFNDSGAPISGEWRVIGHVSGCNEIRIFNILFHFTPEGQMVRTGLLPGTTAASLLLQHDALKYAVMGMRGLMPAQDCKDIQFTNTSFEGFDKEPAGNHSSWSEKWIVRTCGVSGVVTLHFIPDKTGTAIMMDPKETQRL